MRELLGPIGLGALICVPCLIIGGGAIAVASGGLLAAVAANPLLHLLGLSVLGAGALLAVRAFRLRRQSCAECEVWAARHANHPPLAMPQPPRER